MLPSKQEIEAELERKRLEARERNKHADSVSRGIAPLIFVPALAWGVLCLTMLYAFADWQTIGRFAVISGGLVATAIIAIWINRKNGSPVSSYVIFNVLLVAIVGVLYFLLDA